MYPYIRSAYAIFCARSMPPIEAYGTHVSHHRAWPWDTDVFGELNNGRILTVFELGRWQLAVRLGIIGLFMRSNLTLAVAGVSVRYRKRVPMLQRYRMQTQMLGYDDRFFYVEQSMWQGDTCMNQMLLRFAARDKTGTVPPPDFLLMADLQSVKPDLPDWVKAWIEADKTRPWPPESGPVLHNT